MEWELNKLECRPRGYQDFGYSGLQCWGYSEDDVKVPIGPYSSSSKLGKFYSLELDISDVNRITSSENLRFMIEFNQPQTCKFEVHAGKRVRGNLVC